MGSLTDKYRALAQQTEAQTKEKAKNDKLANLRQPFIAEAPVFAQSLEKLDFVQLRTDLESIVDKHAERIATGEVVIENIEDYTDIKREYTPSEGLVELQNRWDIMIQAVDGLEKLAHAGGDLTSLSANDIDAACCFSAYLLDDAFYYGTGTCCKIPLTALSQYGQLQDTVKALKKFNAKLEAAGSGIGAQYIQYNSLKNGPGG